MAVVAVTDFPDGFSVQAYADSANTATYLDSDPSEAKTTVDFFGIPVHGNVLFVIDASGSMETDFGGISRFQAALKAVIASINSLDANQTFSVTMFHGSTAWSDGTWKMLSATKKNKEAVITAIQSVVTGPGTSYQTALSHPAQDAFAGDVDHPIAGLVAEVGIDATDVEHGDDQEHCRAAIGFQQLQRCGRGLLQ